MSVDDDQLDVPEIDQPPFFDFDDSPAPTAPAAVETPAPEPEPGPGPAPDGDRGERPDDTLWRKWSVFQGKGRFCSVRLWLPAGRAVIDIGETSEGHTLKGNTATFVKLVPLVAWLRAVRDGRGEALYPTNARVGVDTPEGFIAYGGGVIEGQPVSRVFKAHHWPTGREGHDPSAFIWKAAHFAASRNDQGAFIPDMKRPLSFHSIKMSRVEMAELALCLEVALTHLASGTDTQALVDTLSGRRRD